jgi:hypothetical protein
MRKPEPGPFDIRSPLAAHVESEGRACSGPWTNQGVSGAWMPLLLLPPLLPMTPGGVYSPQCLEVGFSEVVPRIHREFIALDLNDS